MMWFIERMALGSFGFHLPVANHRLNILVENFRNKELTRLHFGAFLDSRMRSYAVLLRV